MQQKEQQKEYYRLYINNILQSETLEAEEDYFTIAAQVEGILNAKQTLPIINKETLKQTKKSMKSMEGIAKNINSIVKEHLKNSNNEDLNYRYQVYIDYRTNLPYDQFQNARQIYKDISQQTGMFKQITDTILLQVNLEQHYKIIEQLNSFHMYILMQQEMSDLQNKLELDINYLEYKLYRKPDRSDLSQQRPRNGLSITESVVEMIGQLSILCRFLVPDKIQIILEITPTTVVNSEYTIILLSTPHLGLITSSNNIKQANRYFVPASRVPLQAAYDQVYGAGEYTHKDEMLIQAFSLFNILHKINQFCQEARVLSVEVDTNQIQESVDKFNEYTERIGYFDYYLFTRQFEIKLY